MWFRHRSVVDPKHPFHDFAQLGRHRQRADTTTVGAPVMLVMFNGRPERSREVGSGPREKNAAPGRARFHDNEVVGSSECFDLRHICRVRTMRRGVLLAREVTPIHGQLVGMESADRTLESGLSTNSDGHFKALVIRNRTVDTRCVMRAAFAATNCDAVVICRHGVLHCEFP